MRANRNSASWLVAGVLAVANASCASFYYQDKTCHWLELEQAPGLEVTSVRVTGAPWRECSNVNAPGYYRLQRHAYTVEFWNGDRGDFANLYLRALDGGGTRLAVRSRQFDGEPNAHLSGSAGAREDYDYFLVERLRVYKPGERIEFAVLDAAGQEVGLESLRVVSKTGGKWRSYH